MEDKQKNQEIKEVAKLKKDESLHSSLIRYAVNVDVETEGPLRSIPLCNVGHVLNALKDILESKEGLVGIMSSPAYVSWYDLKEKEEQRWIKDMIFTYSNLPDHYTTTDLFPKAGNTFGYVSEDGNVIIFDFS